MTVWLNPGQARVNSQLSLHYVVDTHLLKSHFLNINQSRHFANLTYFSFIKPEGILEKQKVEHLSECQDDDYALEERLAWSLNPPTSLASSDPGPDQWEWRKWQVKAAEDMERKKRRKEAERDQEENSQEGQMGKPGRYHKEGRPPSTEMQ